MRDFKRRLRQLEAGRRQRQPGHFVGIVRVPWHVRSEDMWEWALEHTACLCGTPRCPERILGVAPEMAPSVEAWAERYQRMLSRTPEQRAADEAAWLALHGERAD